MLERKSGLNASWSIKPINSGIILIILLFAMLFLSNVASAANETIEIGTNRYVVLDDPINYAGSGAKAGPGYVLPYLNEWGSTANDKWKGTQTTIGADALYMDGNGTALADKTVTFTLYYPNNSVMATGTAVTNSSGVASFYKDLNNAKYYGEWKIKAESTGTSSSNTSFIYNWWGCAYSGGCGNQHSGKNPNNYGTAPANSPYTASWEMITSRSDHHDTGITGRGWTDDYCTVCHQSYDGNPTTSNATGSGTKDFYVNDVHRTISCMNSSCHDVNGTSAWNNHNTGAITIGSCTNCHTRTDITDKSTLNGVVSNYSNSTIGAGPYDKYHTPTSTVPCIVCHGPMHNITKPDESQRFIKNNATEDSQCKTCHKDYNKHSGSVNCTLCHSDDVHAIQVFSQSAGYVNKGNAYQGNCTNCHQNSTFLGTLNASLKAGKYMGSPAPQVKKPLNHSDDPLAGTKWGSHWTSQQTACMYCHNETQHDLNALGKMILSWAPNYQMYGTIGTNTSCASCHYKGDSNYTQMSSTFTSAGLLLPPEITNGTNWKGISTGYFNHSFANYTDLDCDTCHGSLLSPTATMGEFLHNVDVGKAGNPDCVSCHDIGKSQAKVDVANIKASIHLNLNTGGNAGSYNADNKICWGCHTNSTVSADGKVDATELPAGSHPDSYNIPKKCTQCHTGGGNFNALIVSEHNSAGTDIRTKPQADTNTSCVNCHMKSEMITTNSDPGGPKSNIANVSHYGSNKTGISPYNVGGASNCTLCHQGSSVFSSEMVNAAWNASISNHSTNYASTNPGCANCHSTGRIHDSTLTKPAFSLPNSAYCLACHNSTGSATLKNKEQHNGTVDCTKCHLNTNKNIHPVQYLEQSGTTFATTKTNAVNCTNCHQVKLANFTNAPIIPDPLKHSASLSNGTLWGTFWTSESGSCFYCHSDTRHNNTAFGRISSLLLDPSNTRNGAIANTQWCSDCHYNDAANTNYRGNQLSPVPPTITINNTGVPGWVDHTGYLTGGYKDNVCESCHALNGASSKTSLNYSHSLNEGVAGGADCVSCHSTALGGGKQVNTNAMNDTNALHKNLNSLAPNGGLSAENKKCWACHGDGSNPGSGHPSNYRTPYRCADCHVPGAGQNMKYNPNTTLLNVSQHYQGSNNIKTQAAGTCYDCHNKSEMMLGLNLDPDGAGSVYGGANGGSGSSSHYGKKRTDYPVQNTNDYCYKCHNNGSTIFPFIDTANKTISNHSTNHASTNPDCADCHSTGRIHNSTLTKPAFSLPNSAYCLACHNSTGSATLKNKEQHNGTVDCTKCHLNTNKNIHPVQYLEQSGTTFATTKTNAVNCTNCHQAPLPGFGNAPIIPDPLKHSASLSNGTLWGTFWTSESGSCFYCHSDTRHNTTALGKINNLLLNPSNTRNGAIANTQWCSDCHYNDPANTNYRGNQLSPVPPTITVNNTGKPGWVDHTGYLTGGYKDNVCESCHALNGASSKTSLNYSHSLNVGVAGGADCVSCHSTALGGGKQVNTNAMNDTNSLHKNLNSLAPNGGLSAENKKCWACHGDGSNPGSGHPSNYRTPYRCADCHVPGAGQNMKYTPNTTLLNVSQHYQGGNNIKTQAAGTCYDCHNKSEMMVGLNLDPDGAGSVYGGANGGSGSSSHYGKKRTDYPVQNTNAYCYKCHNNGSTIFPFIDTANKTISNHSTNHASTNPDCADCHSTGRIHNSTLTKPAFSLPNSAYCLACHNSTGSATLKNKEQHNGTVDCTKCHLNTNKNIHPVQYLEQGGTTFATTKTNAVNCTNCHQAQLPGFGNAPIIPDPLKHSASLSNGTLWGTFWTSESGSCFYCHSDTRHNTTALGRINSLLLDPSNTRNGAIANTQWCSDCHYNDAANTNYRGNQLSPVPPTITINNTGKPGWVDHTGYLTGGYKDNVCETCHAQMGTYSKTSMNYSHSLNVGAAGGANCVACHDVGGSAPKLINAASIQSGIHKDLNGATADINKACYACHGDGTPPVSGHPANYKNPKACTECHTDGTFTAPLIQNHRPAGVSIKTASYCSTCHNNSINNFAYTINATVSHYGTNTSLVKPTVNQTTLPRYGFFTNAEASAYNGPCNNCHNNYPLNLSYGNATTITSAHTSTGACNQCHVNGNADNLHNGSLAMPVTFKCKDCHTIYADLYKAPNLTGTRHSGYDCTTNCHTFPLSNVNDSFDTLNEHNSVMSVNGNPPTTDIVYLNGVTTLSIPKGRIVTITSRVNDKSNGLSSRVRGAEYYNDSDPGIGNGISMAAVDGQFDAVDGVWENIIGTLNTSSMTVATHTVYVRGLDIGKQWSTSSATLTVTEPTGFINGTVKEGLNGIPDATVMTNAGNSTSTDGSGFYSLSLPAGTYTLTASKDPEFNANNTIPPVTVNVSETAIQNILLTRKSVYALSGRVTNATSGLGINGALVKLDAYSQYNTTTVSGDYSMNVPGGTYQVSASASGYATNVTTVAVNSNKNQNFILTPSSGIFIPWIAYSQTDWYTPIQVQNIGASASDVSVSMYDQNGNLVATQTATIQPNTASVFWPPAGPTAGGSAVITSTQNVVAVVNEMPKNGLDGMSYSGFTQGSTKVYIPWIAYSQTDWYTPIQVQNIDSAPADVSVAMYDQTGNPVVTQTATIQPKTASVFWPPAGSTAGGSAVITSTRNVIAIVNEMGKITSQGMSYEGFIAGSKKVYIPAINFSQTNTYTPIQVQNIGTASATVNVKIYDSNGLLVQTQSGVIPPNTASVFWPPTASTASGSAVIESTQDVIAIVNAMINNNNWAMSYDGFAAGSSQVFIPWIAYGNSGWNTPVYIQNTGTVSTNVAVSFFDQNGAPVETRNAVIPANTSQIFVPASTAPTTGGSAVVTSVQPVVAEVSEINAASTNAMGYGGYLG